MAIAFDQKTHQTDGGGAVSSKTVAITVTGSNTYGVVFIEGSTVADRITGVTWNGVSMVQATNGGAGYKADSGRYLNCFVKHGVATGNVVISSSPADIIGASILDFTGAQQTDTPDSNNKATSASTASFSPATTVVASNCWLAAFAHMTGGSIGFGSGNDGRGETTADGFAAGDSNGTVSTGSQSLNFTQTAGAATGLIISIGVSAQTYARTASVTMMNASSRLATVARAHGFPRAVSVTMMNAASRLATVARAHGYPRTASVTMMNAASRRATVVRIYGTPRTASVTMMNAASRLATVSKQHILKIGSVFRWCFSTWD